METNTVGWARRLENCEHSKQECTELQDATYSPDPIFLRPLFNPSIIYSHFQLSFVSFYMVLFFYPSTLLFLYPSILSSRDRVMLWS